MKFNVQHMGAEQHVELSWLSGITNAAELLRIATLEVGESIILQRGSARRLAGRQDRSPARHATGALLVAYKKLGLPIIQQSQLSARRAGAEVL